MLQIEGLHKAHGPVPVLQGVDLQVAEGTLTAVLGASGSGKTTLLRVIAGFERAQSGIVRLNGQVLDDGNGWVPPERRNITFVSQDGSLFPHLTVAGNVGFGLPRRERTPESIRELLRLVGLAGLEKRYPHELSGGEQQRVSLARALAPRPRLILLDEPFSALDETLRNSLRQEVVAVLKQTGVTAVLVTHDQDEALSLADNVAILRGGTMAQTDIPERIYRFPADADLARFVGKANVVDAVVEDGQALCAFGPLTVADKPVRFSGDASIVIRPEQLALAEDGEGLPGLVNNVEYFGHDVILVIRPLEACGAAELIVRIAGHITVRLGSQVYLKAVGEVHAWPRH
jgi:iron(III) transport system ATP-binding protein